MTTLRVLVVDDDASVRRVLDRALKLQGHTVLQASSGDEAFELLRQYEIDLVLMDLRMPSMSGQTLYHMIASQWPHLARRVIVMSGDPEARDHEEWLSLNDLALISKPFELPHLFALIGRLLTDARRQADGG